MFLVSLSSSCAKGQGRGGRDALHFGKHPVRWTARCPQRLAGASPTTCEVVGSRGYLLPALLLVAPPCVVGSLLLCHAHVELLPLPRAPVARKLEVLHLGEGLHAAAGSEDLFPVRDGLGDGGRAERREAGILFLHRAGHLSTHGTTVTTEPLPGACAIETWELWGGDSGCDVGREGTPCPRTGRARTHAESRSAG